MPKIFYICDRKKCKRCNSDCKHTSDINHAANFKSVSIEADGQNISATNDYFENDRVVTPLSLYQHGLGDIATCIGTTTSSSKEE